MALSDFLFGSSGGLKQQPLYNQQQLQALSQLLSAGLQEAQKPSYEGFEPIAQLHRSQFLQKTVPTIAERFEGMGAGKSSGLYQTLGGAGADLESQLAALRSQYGLGQQQLGLQQLGMGITPLTQSYYEPETHGFLGNLLGVGAQGLGSALGAGATGGLGSLLPLLSSLLGGGSARGFQQQTRSQPLNLSFNSRPGFGAATQMSLQKLLGQ